MHLFVTFTLLFCVATVAGSTTPPNILLILADDLGYSDIGCYGGEIDTPNLDNLASNGLRYTNFYNTARCWPTRAALLTGYYAQQVRRDNLPGIKRGIRPKWAKLLPQYLKKYGYRSYHSGKWHIDGTPLSNGFDKSHEISNHGFFRLPKFSINGKIHPGKELAKDWYATTAKANYAIQFLKEHAQDHPGKPFFQFLAFTAPHFPLHAKPEDIDKFRERYQEGWNKIQKQRWAKQVELGLVSKSHPLPDPERNVGPPYHFENAYKILGEGEVRYPLPWRDLTKVQQEFQAEKMAIHAAMVYRMDLEIGRVLKQIQRMGQLDNTIVLFLSDNGASAEIMVRGDGHDPSQPMGSAFTYLCLGPGWSTACNTPFRKHKTWVHEGGCATPLIIHWPNGIHSRGEIRTGVGHVVDLVPTLLSCISKEESRKWLASSKRPQSPGLDLSSSFVESGCMRSSPLWFSHEGNRAIRDGDWKLVSVKNEKWELYSLKDDRNETINLADKLPGRTKELSALWHRLQDQFVKDIQAK